MRGRLAAWGATGVVAGVAVVVAVVSVAASPASRATRRGDGVVSPAAPGAVTETRLPPAGAHCGASGAAVASHLVAIDFVGASTGYGLASLPAAGGRGPMVEELVATHDGGRTWVVRCPSTPGVFLAGHLAPSLGPVHLTFVDATAGYLWGPMGVAVTGDGGRHWLRRLVGDVTGFAASGMAAWAAVTTCRQGSAGLDCTTTVVSTADAGAAWRALPGLVSPRPGGSIAVAATSIGAVAFAVLPPGPITTPETVAAFVHTPGTAGTRSLAPFRCPAYTTDVGLHATDGGGTLWATCRGGTGESSWLAIDRSTNGGASWHAESSAGAFGPAVSMGFPHTAGGWQPATLAPATANRAALFEAFGDPAVGAAGVYLTTDGGASWQLTWPLAHLNGASFAAVDFVTGDLGWLAVHCQPGGPPGQLLQTTDGGANWHPVAARGGAR